MSGATEYEDVPVTLEMRWALLDELLATQPGSPAAERAVERLRDVMRATSAGGGFTCRVCGCTRHRACLDQVTGSHCRWVGRDLCSACRLSGEQVRQVRQRLELNKGVFAAELQISFDRLFEVENCDAQLPDHAVYRLRRLMGDDLAESRFTRTPSMAEVRPKHPHPAFHKGVRE